MSRSGEDGRVGKMMTVDKANLSSKWDMQALQLQDVIAILANIPEILRRTLELDEKQLHWIYSREVLGGLYPFFF